MGRKSVYTTGFSHYVHTELRFNIQGGSNFQKIKKDGKFMKKIVLVLAVVLFVLNIGFRAEASSAELVTVIVDGRTIEFTDAPAYLDANGRVQVPVRFVGEALGAL